MSAVDQLLEPVDFVTLPDAEPSKFVEGHLMDQEIGARSEWVAGMVQH